MNQGKNGAENKAVCVMGGDGRQYYLAQKLAESGYYVRVYGIAVPLANGNSLKAEDTVSGKMTDKAWDFEKRVVENGIILLDESCSDELIVAELSKNAANNGLESFETESNDGTAQQTDGADKNYSQNETVDEKKRGVSRFNGGITVCGDIANALRGCGDVILPFPLSPDGVTLNCSEEEKPSLSNVFHAVSEVCGSAARVYAGAVKERSREIAASFGIDITDYGAMEEIALENAVPTAEGAVKTAMEALNVTVRGSRFAVIGYGRCGSELARLLRAMGAEVCGIARSGRDRAKMRNDGVKAMDFSALTEAVNGSEITFNTVPFNVFDCRTLAELAEGRVIIELASAPGGVDRECAARYGVRVIHAPSLPGKYAPKTAAEIIARALIPLLEG